MGENLSIVPAPGPGPGPEPAPAPLRLLLVDDQQVVLEGLRSMMAAHSARIVIAAATTNAEDALRLAAEVHPDVVLLDVRLRGA
ncbi:MAG: response regulator, partial [Acidimicrobiales bacterium]|nr:response regulator [Acidimicrobiales bacterium]